MQNVIPLLFAAESAPVEWYRTAWALLSFLCGVTVLSFMIGKFAGKWLRMPDYWWKIGLILCALGCGIVIVSTQRPKFGVDLRGGVTLIYEVESNEEDGALNMNAIVQQLKRRANPGGTKEVVIRKYGSNQVEIIVPELTQDEINELKKLLETAGLLNFYIVANEFKDEHKFAIELAQEQRDTAKWVYDYDSAEEGETPPRVAMWAKVGREDQDVSKRKRGVYPFKTDVSGRHYSQCRNP